MDIEKGWGKEVIFASTENYCGKFLQFNRAGDKTAVFLHAKKDKSWVVMEGIFRLTIVDTNNGNNHESILRKGDTWNNPPMLPHQLEALQENSIIIEVSTADDNNDIYYITASDQT